MAFNQVNALEFNEIKAQIKGLFKKSQDQFYVIMTLRDRL